MADIRLAVAALIARLISVQTSKRRQRYVVTDSQKLNPTLHVCSWNLTSTTILSAFRVPWRGGMGTERKVKLLKSPLVSGKVSSPDTFVSTSPISHK